MTAKLHIDMSQGIISIEGDPDFIRDIYRDFKEHLATGLPKLGGVRATAQPPSDSSTAPPEPAAKPKARPRGVAKKRADAVENISGVNPKAPKLDKNIDTSSLANFYSQFEPKNNSEKILVFLNYLSDKLGIEEPNTDQVYTLFKKTGDKIPKAFAQAFHDMGSKQGFIDFSATDGSIRVTIAGENHFNHDLKRKAVD